MNRCVKESKGVRQNSSSFTEETSATYTSTTSDEELSEDLAEYDTLSPKPKFLALLRIMKGSGCSNKTLLCNSSCSQGKLVLKKGGCCICSCRKGYSLNENGLRCDKGKKINFMNS